MRLHPFRTPAQALPKSVQPSKLNAKSANVQRLQSKPLSAVGSVKEATLEKVSEAPSNQGVAAGTHSSTLPRHHGFAGEGSGGVEACHHPRPCTTRAATISHLTTMADAQDPGKTQDRSGPLEPPKAGVATTASKATLHEAPTLEPATCPCATALFWRHCGSLRSWHQPQPPTKPAQDQKSPLRIVDPLVDPGHPA